jgi:hypothetical protein
VEPVQTGERRITVQKEATPYLMIGYHTPETKHRITTPWIFSVRFFPVANHPDCMLHW